MKIPLHRMKLDTYELAWAAGFFDGEGTCHFEDKGKKGSGLKIAAYQSDCLPLRRFLIALGNLGKLRGPYKTKHKPMFYWTAQSYETVQAVVCMLWKFLSEPKRRQILTAFKQYHSRPLTRKSPIRKVYQ